MSNLFLTKAWLFELLWGHYGENHSRCKEMAIHTYIHVCVCTHIL